MIRFWSHIDYLRLWAFFVLRSQDPVSVSHRERLPVGHRLPFAEVRVCSVRLEQLEARSTSLLGMLIDVDPWTDSGDAISLQGMKRWKYRSGTRNRLPANPN